MIHHVAVWVSDLEKTRTFYVKYFGCVSNEGYYNPTKEFRSYFLSFEDGSKLELMQTPTVSESNNDAEKQFIGFAHIAISVGSVEKVDSLTKQLVDDGYILASPPRKTGDGYYESCIFDPDMNRVEITI